MCIRDRQKRQREHCLHGVTRWRTRLLNVTMHKPYDVRLLFQVQVDALVDKSHVAPGQPIVIAQRGAAPQCEGQDVE